MVCRAHQRHPEYCFRIDLIIWEMPFHPINRLTSGVPKRVKIPGDFPNRVNDAKEIKFEHALDYLPCSFFRQDAVDFVSDALSTDLVQDALAYRITNALLIGFDDLKAVTPLVPYRPEDPGWIVNETPIMQRANAPGA
jgi:hypothetical protein